MWKSSIPPAEPVPAGERGEITLTGGFNFCLPLLRYRTGDFASLDFVRGSRCCAGSRAGRPCASAGLMASG